MEDPNKPVEVDVAPNPVEGVVDGVPNPPGDVGCPNPVLGVVPNPDAN